VIGRKRSCARGVPLLLLALGLVGCDNGTDLAASVVGSIPGYVAAPGDSGSLDRATATSSLPTSPEATAKALDAAGFSAGYSRVFLRGGQAGGDYVLVSVYAVSGPAGAQGLVAFERRSLADTGTVAVFPVAAIPGAVGFILSAPTHRGDHQVFCAGVIFARGTQVDAVTTCSAMPEDAQLATQVAQRQANLAR
jgi:hypothetical protein